MNENVNERTRFMQILIYTGSSQVQLNQLTDDRKTFSIAIQDPPPKRMSF